MQTIKFPRLKLQFNISPVAIKIGENGIRWYAIFIVIAFILALYLARRKDGLYNIKYENILECFIFVIPISIICARLYYCLFKLEIYINNPLEILNIRNGGLAIYGGIIGGAIVSCIYCKNKKINILDLLDYIVPSLALGQAIGRWGNFFNVEAYGTKTNSILRMEILENNTYVQVHPTFLYESIITFLLFLYLTKIQKRRKIKGEIVYTYLIIYSFERIFIEGIRSDSLMLFNLKISQILSIIIFVIFCSILVYKKIKYKKNNICDKKCGKITYEM